MQDTAMMRVRFWGVRGSIACPGPETIRYGGNTPCIEVRCAERVVIFDAGTGLRALGNALIKDRTVREYDIFLTHCHLDHVIGLPFFAPFFAEGYRIRIWAGNLLPADNIQQVMRRLMSSPLFPVEVEIFKSAIEFHDFSSGDVLRPFSDITLRTAPLDHPDGASGYRLEHGGRVFSIISDTEGYPGKRDKELLALARGADLIIYDSTFTEEEIATRHGWGHSTWARGIRLAEEAGAKQLCLFHHDPSHDDNFMDMVAADANDARPGTITAREGQIIDL
jgi:phosphoribosyl 1,2-cyclic phosphodiesterase